MQLLAVEKPITDFFMGCVSITYSDISKAKKELDYQPQVNIEDGIQSFVKWFKEVQNF